MGEISQALSQMIIMLLICLVGFIATKAGVFKGEQIDDFTRMLMKLTLPCMMFASVNTMQGGDGIQFALAVLLAVLQFVGLLVCALLCNFLFRTPKKDRKIYIFMAICTNTGFIGLPVVSSIYGNESVLFCGIFITVLAFFIYSVGFGVLGTNDEGDKMKIPWKAMVNPAMIASVISIVLVLLNVTFPPILHSTFSMIGGLTGPIAMLVVGIIIARTDLKKLFSEWRLYPFIIIRQLVVPALIFVALDFFGVPSLLSGVFTLMFAMPVGAMAPSFALMMGKSPDLPAKGTVLSTIAAFVIIPVLVIWMNFIGM